MVIYPFRYQVIDRQQLYLFPGDSMHMGPGYPSRLPCCCSLIITDCRVDAMAYNFNLGSCSPEKNVLNSLNIIEPPKTDTMGNIIRFQLLLVILLYIYEYCSLLCTTHHYDYEEDGYKGYICICNIWNYIQESSRKLFKI